MAGESHELALKNSKTHTNKFEDGNTDVFDFRYVPPNLIFLPVALGDFEYLPHFLFLYESFLAFSIWVTCKKLLFGMTIRASGLRGFWKIYASRLVSEQVLKTFLFF